MGNKEASTKCATFSVLENGIIRITLLEGSEIELDESKLMQKTSWDIAGNKKFVALIDARARVVVTKESREWGSTPEAQANMLAQAIVVNSLANKIVGNFIIKFHNPVAKTRLFSDSESAMEWLREQKKIFNL